MRRPGSYPPLAEYGLIGDCHSAALVARDGSIDWCCLPRFDSDSCFGRLLDSERGGHFAIAPRESCSVRRGYLGDSLILETTFSGERGEARLTDFFAMRRGGRCRPRRELVRVVEGLRGTLDFEVEIAPRLDFGEVKPWIYPVGDDAYHVVGSNTGLVIFGDLPLVPAGRHDLTARFEVRAGERRHVALHFVRPHDLAVEDPPSAKTPAMLDAHHAETRDWWDRWADRLELDAYDGGQRRAVLRSATVLKALSFAPSGAIVAAPTTSLPEEIGGERNWDYRYSWVRDSVFAVRALAELGCAREADGFRGFVQRSAAGSAAEIQPIYAVDGRHSLPELELPNLHGWRGSRPVRIGNAAAKQFQADVYGLLLEHAWHWVERGNVLGEPYWSFLVDLVEASIANCRAPDRGLWEIRSPPQHFVHSKVMCWLAMDRGLALAARCGLDAPRERWDSARRGLRAQILERGVDHERGIFVQAYDGREVDAALLLLPYVGFLEYDDDRMVRTTDAIARELQHDGLVLRYRTEDGLRGSEGMFLPCSFWLAECYARQGRVPEARRIYERAIRCANDLGLFPEEYSPGSGAMLGNFPQGLTHLAHLSAASALHAARRP